ncbi:MAG TPA: ribosome recycling factor [Candidatus Margulisiibacteriota bacterium]|nr:ribosome recycling factor [Candidatus Margulisiibacteriota bacterium]
MTDEVIEDLRKEMERTLTALRKDLTRTRTGRASTALLEGITVDYYGTRTPLNQLAGLAAPEPRLLVIQPYDKSALVQIERAILQSDLGLVPVNDGKILRVPIPELTEERRRELVKHIRKVGEDYRVSIRNHRRDALDLLKSLEKDKEITEDDVRKATEKVQEITKTYTEKVDQVLKVKEEEIMEV